MDLWHPGSNLNFILILTISSVSIAANSNLADALKLRNENFRWKHTATNHY
jgi:hypothetical protein